jgi:hypothetical protein
MTSVSNLAVPARRSLRPYFPLPAPILQAGSHFLTGRRSSVLLVLCWFRVNGSSLCAPS